MTRFGFIVGAGISVVIGAAAWALAEAWLGSIGAILIFVGLGILFFTLGAIVAVLVEGPDE